MDKDTHFLD